MMTKNKTNVMTTVVSGLLVALSIVFTKILVFMPTETLRVGIGKVPIMLAGFLFGSMNGGVVGIAADLVGLAINPQGPPHLGFTLSSMLWGVIPGISRNISRKLGREKSYSNIEIVTVVFVCFLVISLVLDTYWLSHMYGKGFIVILPGRLVSAAIHIPVYSVVIISILKNLRRHFDI